MSRNHLSRIAPNTLRQSWTAYFCGRKSKKGQICIQADARHKLEDLSLAHPLVLHSDCKNISALRFTTVVDRLTKTHRKPLESARPAKQPSSLKTAKLAGELLAAGGLIQIYVDPSGIARRVKAVQQVSTTRFPF